MRKYKPFVSQKKVAPLNPGLEDPELVSRLCEKSKQLFGAKWRWRKLAAKAYCSAEKMEETFDIIINQRKPKENKKDERESVDNKQLGNDAGRHQSDGTGESGAKKRAVPGDQERSKGKDNEGQEVRSGKTPDESATTRGSE